MRIDIALKDCTDIVAVDYEAMFVPQLIDIRIRNPKGSKIWQNGWATPSIKATGVSKGGNPVVVYAHTDNYFSKHANIKVATTCVGLLNGAGIIPKEEFQRLLDLEDGLNVFVVDYNTLKNSESEVIEVKNALKHPQMIPFIGGEERAEAYLDKYVKIYNKNTIENWYSADLQSTGTPVGRLLFLGCHILSSSSKLDNKGRFVWVPKTPYKDGTLKTIESEKP